MKDLTTYSVEEAVKKVKASAKENFNATVEAHINFDLDVRKAEQALRFSITLPNGTGKTKKVAVLASKKVANADIELMESDIERLEKGNLRPKVDFDVLVAEPKFMSKLAKAARVLGPAGVMPNPKNGTVTDEVEKAVELIKKGKVEVRTEKDAPVAHTLIGKSNFDESALVENLNELLKAIKQNKPAKTSPEWVKSITICTTMGSPVRVSVASLLG